MASTDRFYSLLGAATGAQPVSAASWAFGAWVEVGTTNTQIAICGLVWQVTNVPSADTTYEQVFEIGTGSQGNEVTILQFPYSFRADTAVGYYNDTRACFLPEPRVVPQGITLSVRAANSVASSVTYQAVKIRYQSSAGVIPAQGLPNNYQFVKAASGMSCSERIR